MVEFLVIAEPSPCVRLIAYAMHRTALIGSFDEELHLDQSEQVTKYLHD